MLRTVALLAVAVALAGCGTSPQEEAAVTPDSVEGVITDIASSGLNEVSSFTVRHDGTTTTVYVREDFDYGFPLGHLQAHLTSGDPVLVEGEVIDGKLFADSIEDA